MTKIAITGAAGRMGNILITCALADPEITLKVISVNPNTVCPALIQGIKPTQDLRQFINEFEVLIDYTNPQATLANLALCQKHQKKIVIGTTGFSDDEKQMIHQAGLRIPIFMSPNTSVGMYTCLQVIAKAAQLNKDADIEIIELHHRHKKDAPSGTSLKIGETIAQMLGKSLSELIMDRTKPKPNQIGFSTLRAGDVVGEHTVMFVHEGERLEITHRVTNRHPFALGALRAAKWLTLQAPGLYGMADLLG